MIVCEKTAYKYDLVNSRLCFITENQYRSTLLLLSMNYTIIPMYKINQIIICWKYIQKYYPTSFDGSIGVGVPRLGFYQKGPKLVILNWNPLSCRTFVLWNPLFINIETLAMVGYHVWHMVITLISLSLHQLVWHIYPCTWSTFHHVHNAHPNNGWGFFILW